MRAALSLSDALGVKVIAEGVENQEVYEWLKSEGCEFAQGYYISKPLDANEIISMVTNYKTL